MKFFLTIFVGMTACLGLLSLYTTNEDSLVKVTVCGRTFGVRLSAKIFDTSPRPWGGGVEMNLSLWIKRHISKTQLFLVQPSKMSGNLFTFMM